MIFHKILNILLERITSTSVNYGSKYPFDNSLFIKNDNELTTFFEHEDNIIVVFYDTQSKSINFSILDNSGLANMSHKASNVNFRYIQQFYGKLIYVISEMIQKIHISEFIFYSSPLEAKVEKLYDNFCHNTNVKTILQSLGFINYKQSIIIENDLKFVVHQFSKDKFKIRIPVISKLMRIMK